MVDTMATLRPGPWEEPNLFDPVAYDHPDLQRVWETWLNHCSDVHPVAARTGLTEKSKRLIFGAIREFGIEAVCGAIEAASRKPYFRKKNKKGNGPFLLLSQILDPDWIEGHIDSWRESPEYKFLNED